MIWTLVQTYEWFRCFFFSFRRISVLESPCPFLSPCTPSIVTTLLYVWSVIATHYSSSMVFPYPTLKNSLNLPPKLQPLSAGPPKQPLLLLPSLIAKRKRPPVPLPHIRSGTKTCQALLMMPTPIRALTVLNCYEATFKNIKLLEGSSKIFPQPLSRTDD